MLVFVRDNDVGSALRVLKKKLQREGVFREMKRRRAYEKPMHDRFLSMPDPRSIAQQSAEKSQSIFQGDRMSQARCCLH